jgi:putative FmdB family regulatory protein
LPIYEYACDSCGHRFEKLVRVGAEPPPCPECASAVRKLVSQSGFILRGGGWYKDHYGLKSPAASSGGEGGESKTESKPESKPATTSTSDSATTKKSDGGGGTTGGSGSGGASGGGTPPKTSSSAAAAK